MEGTASRGWSFLDRVSSALDRHIQYVLIAPCIIFLLAIGIFPLLYSARLMFFDWTITAQRGQIFVGFDNFVRLSQDRLFWTALRNTAVFVVAAVTLELVLGLGLALLLNRKFRGQGVFRVIFLLPMMDAPVAVGYTWRMLFHVSDGPLNNLLSLVGLPPCDWLSSISTALPSIILIDVWQWTPFVFVLLLAGLQSLPREPYEAAMVAGASRWQTFKYITNHHPYAGSSAGYRRSASSG